MRPRFEYHGNQSSSSPRHRARERALARLCERRRPVQPASCFRRKSKLPATSKELGDKQCHSFIQDLEYSASRHIETSFVRAKCPRSTTRLPEKSCSCGSIRHHVLALLHRVKHCKQIIVMAFVVLRGLSRGLRAIFITHA